MTLSNGNNDRRFVSRRVLDILFIFQLFLNVIALTVLLSVSYLSFSTVGRIDRRQVEAVQLQNDTQICAQHDLILAIKRVGVDLNLPAVRDIRPPSIEGINCEALRG
jgi:hypothetical protein